MSIYTKNGDQGMTSLLSGKRISKDHSIIQLVGHIDEATSHLGMAKVKLEADYAKEIKAIQSKLIQVMSVVSGQFTKAINLAEDTSNLENRIDDFQKMFPELTEFVVPGEDETSARLDITRTIVRRCERQLIGIDTQSESAKEIGRYFNRLSDYLFAMARMIEFREKIKRALLAEQGNITSITTRRLNNMTFAIAKAIAEKVVERANENQSAIVVSIVNKDGIPSLTHRMDDAFVVSFALARKKAYTSAVLKMPTHELAKLTAKGADFEGLEGMLDEEIVTLGGGFPIVLNGTIIGAIGVSGGTVESDMNLAKYGAELIEEVIGEDNL